MKSSDLLFFPRKTANKSSITFQVDLEKTIKIPFKYVIGPSGIEKSKNKFIQIKDGNVRYESVRPGSETAEARVLKTSGIKLVQQHSTHNLLCLTGTLPKTRQDEHIWVFVDIVARHNYFVYINRLKSHYTVTDIDEPLFESLTAKLRLMANSDVSHEAEFSQDAMRLLNVNSQPLPPLPPPENPRAPLPPPPPPAEETKPPLPPGSSSASKRKLTDRNALEDMKLNINGGSSPATPISKKRKMEKARNKYVYVASKQHSFEIPESDLLCLKPKMYLNDNIINFYITYIYYHVMNKDQREATYFFNCFFNTKLTGTKSEQKTDTPQSRHARVAKWTKNVDLFSKDYILIPVCEDQHWFLVIVCFPWMAGMVDYAELLGKPGCIENEMTIPLNETQWARTERIQRANDVRRLSGVNPSPCILIFDSLSTQGRIIKVKLIRDYLLTEWDARRAAKDGPLSFDKRTMRGYGPRVPKQPNNCDCGIYLLHYAEMFYKTPITDFAFDYFKERLQSWFTEAHVNEKREYLRSLIVRVSTLSPSLLSDRVTPKPATTVDSAAAGSVVVVASLHNSGSSTDDSQATLAAVDDEDDS